MSKMAAFIWVAPSLAPDHPAAMGAICTAAGRLSSAKCAAPQKIFTAQQGGSDVPNVTQRLAARGDAHPAGVTTLGPQMAWNLARMLLALLLAWCVA
jgi:hypothetical protein